MRYYEIVEARRNPEQNPKVSTLEELEKYAGRDDVFVSFTSDVGKMSHGANIRSSKIGKNISGSKLGINPKSGYKTPIGIYTYPVDHVLSKKGKVEFAAEAPFLYVVQATKPLLDLNNYSETDFARDSEKLIDMGFKDTQEDGIHGSNFDTPASKLWNWTRLAAHENTTKWPKILRALGYSGAVDRGSKVIHPNEPTQAVFFSINAIKVLEVIPNRFEGKPLRKPISDIKNPSEKLKLFAVKQNGYAIRGIKNPSEEVKIAAVQQYGPAIQFIDNPSEEVQIAAVTKNGRAIKHIIDKGITPNEKVQLAAVNNDGSTIQFIDNPSEAVKLAAVRKYGSAIQSISYPSEAVQLAAVQQDGKAIYNILIKDIIPSEQVQLAAVSQDGKAITSIINKKITPSEKVQLAAVQQNSKVILYIKNPSEAVQLAAVQGSGREIKSIIEKGITPSEKVQLAAVQNDKSAIKWIIEKGITPSEAVKKAAGF